MFPYVCDLTLYLAGLRGFGDPLLNGFYFILFYFMLMPVLRARQSNNGICHRLRAGQPLVLHAVQYP
jgi:hypothetical protein